jgi:phage gp29-like protein
MGQILREADVGNTLAMQELFEAIEEDGHIHSVLSKRRNAIVSRQLVVTPAIADDIPSQDAADLVESALIGKDGENGIENWQDALWDLTDAIGRAYSVAQIYWNNDGEKWVPVRLQHWHQRNTVIGDPTSPGGGAGEARRQDEVRILTEKNSTSGEVPDPWQWVIHISRGRTTGLHKAARLRIVAWPYIFKKFAWKGFAIYSDRYGVPMRIGKYPKHADEDERNAILQAAINLGQDGAAAFPVDAMLELVESSKQSSQLPQPLLIAHSDAEFSKVFLGSTLTTEVGSTGGNRALGEVHQGVEDMIANMDAKSLAETIRQQLATPIVRFNMPEGTPVPRIALIPEEQVDLTEVARRDKILADAGLPLSKAQLYEVYGRRPPENDDDAITAPASVPFAPPES